MVFENKTQVRIFSIIVPVYYNEFNLPEMFLQLMTLQEDLPAYRLELIFVDDGSGDRSFEILLGFQKQYPRLIKVVKLTRNFGSMAAIQAGLAVASGNCVGMIAADLQDPPRLFLEMIHHWEQGNKAVFAIRKDREDPLWSKLFSLLYYRFVKSFAISDYPDGGFDFFLIDRQVVNEVNRIREKNTNLMTLMFWLGFKPILLPYTRKHRLKGMSRWTLAGKIKLFIDTFVAFSFFPIRLLSVIGFVAAASSFVYGTFILFYKLLFGISVEGWVATMLVVTFTAGLQTTMLGVLGEYLWRALDEVRRRPTFVIDEIYESSRDVKLKME